MKKKSMYVFGFTMSLVGALVLILGNTSPVLIVLSTVLMLAALTVVSVASRADRPATRR